MQWFFKYIVAWDVEFVYVYILWLLSIFILEMEIDSSTNWWLAGMCLEHMLLEMCVIYVNL